MSRKSEYRMFLSSTFWQELSERKKQLVGRCEDCGNTERLQSHHIEYPADWYQTTLEQLKVLCRWCHAKVHGKSVARRRFMLYRNDERFSRAVGRVDEFTMRIYQGYVLSARDLRFLDLVEKKYPPKPKDSCIQFHVNNCRRVNDFMKAENQAARH